MPATSEIFLTETYGNCYCTLTVVKNQLRPRFTNEIYVDGQRFVCKVNLIMKVDGGERTFLISANAGKGISF